MARSASSLDGSDAAAFWGRADMATESLIRRDRPITNSRPGAALQAGAMDLTEVSLREIRRVSRRELGQAGRDAFACARFSFWAVFNFLVIPAGSRKYGGTSCNPSVLRSYFTPAWRASADMVRQRGAVRRTRGARAPHSGQADGSSHSAIGRSCVNGPHFLHIYSYVGIDPPAETNLAADQSVAIVGKYTAAIDGLRGAPARIVECITFGGGRCVGADGPDLVVAKPARPRPACVFLP
jgi:hypothetical protein